MLRHVVVRRSVGCTLGRVTKSAHPVGLGGDLERAVMEYLWTVSPAAATVREVHESLAESRSLAYTTVMTVLGRMADKGMAEQIRDGRAYRYRPLVSRDEFTAALMHDALDSVDTDDRAAALVRFVGAGSADDVTALRAALDELERHADRE